MSPLTTQESTWKDLGAGCPFGRASLSGEEESLLVMLDSEVEIALWESHLLSLFPRIYIRDLNTGPWLSNALRWMQEDSEWQRAGAVGEFMAEQLPPRPRAADSQGWLRSSCPLQLHKIQHPFFFPSPPFTLLAKPTGNLLFWAVLNFSSFLVARTTWQRFGNSVHNTA